MVRAAIKMIVFVGAMATVASAQTQTSYTVEVSAQKEWTDTNIDLRTGEKVEITAAGELLPAFRTSPSMISDEGKGKGYVEEQAHGSGDDWSAETTGGGAESGGCGEVGVSKHTIYAWKAK